jgi:hypothetical protein
VALFEITPVKMVASNLELPPQRSTLILKAYISAPFQFLKKETQVVCKKS